MAIVLFSGPTPKEKAFALWAQYQELYNLESSLSVPHRMPMPPRPTEPSYADGPSCHICWRYIAIQYSWFHALLYGHPLDIRPVPVITLANLRKE